jgi:NAD+ synthase (glutamine-hydrolysing)
MKIGLLQLDSTVGALRANAEAIARAAHRAQAEGAEFAVTPELILCGYPPQDLLLVSSFRAACEGALERLAEQVPASLPLVVGTIGRLPTGTGLQNVGALLRGGKVEMLFPKTLLPTYDVFDERRYFEPASEPGTNVFEVRPGDASTRVGVTICEDCWNDAELWPARRYAMDPVEEVAKSGARFVVNLSASPFAAGKWRTRHQILTHASHRHKIPTAYVNAVGGNDGLLFDGRSFVVGAGGKLLAEAPGFQEAILVVDTEGAAIDPPLHDDLDDVHDALVMGIRDYFRKVGARSAVVGLSGGIDSALVATLAVEALGPDAVTGIGMPSPYSSEHSIRDAEDLAKRLGIRFHLVPIGSAFSSFKDGLSEMFAGHPRLATDLTEDNLQARIRGTTLMAFSNRTGALVLTTGNKSECAVGYCTLYGDTCGGLAVIADVFKVQVYALCRRINERASRAGKVPPIPENTLEKAPSAELHPDQKDQDDLPPYPVLDRILEGLIERDLGIEDAAAFSQAPIDLVRSIARRVRSNEYKRQQFAPTLRVTDRAWVGRAYPIAQRFED